ncbi:Uncharacterised protein [Achromobacter denitrificans]|nr:Uncharacterised protein [Achromobacter denitrificans]
MTTTVTTEGRGEAFVAAGREKLESALKAVAGPVAGFALFVLMWQVIAMQIPELPTPGVTWHAAVTLFSDPFYDNGPTTRASAGTWWPRWSAWPSALAWRR